MKMVIGFIFGIAVALSFSSFADDTQLTVVQPNLATMSSADDFMVAGGRTDKGVSKMFRMAEDGRVLAKCN